MKIKVDRTVCEDDQLVFKITVTDPKNANFSNVEVEMMKILDMCKESIHQASPDDIKDNQLKYDIVGLIHRAKERAFGRVEEELKFAIKNDLEPKFKPVCQEIYNWIMDKQDPKVRSWLSGRS